MSIRSVRFLTSRANVQAKGRACALSSRLGVLAATLSFAILSGAVSGIMGQEGVSREYTIKAAYLYNLGRYITWPSDAFAGPKSPFVIGVLEPNYVSADLQKYAQVKTIDGRPIQVQVFARPEVVTPCQILFLPRTVDARTQEDITRRLAGTHTLLVGESEEFLDRGGFIAFVIRDNNVRLVIALEAAQREKLQISSKLLQIALPKL